MEFEKLQEIIADVMNIEDKDMITQDSAFVDDLGADSLDVFQIIMGIEEMQQTIKKFWREKARQGFFAFNA